MIKSGESSTPDLSAMIARLESQITTPINGKAPPHSIDFIMQYGLADEKLSKMKEGLRSLREIDSSNEHSILEVNSEKPHTLEISVPAEMADPSYNKVLESIRDVVLGIGVSDTLNEETNEYVISIQGQENLKHLANNGFTFRNWQEYEGPLEERRASPKESALMQTQNPKMALDISAVSDRISRITERFSGQGSDYHKSGRYTHDLTDDMRSALHTLRDMGVAYFQRTPGMDELSYEFDDKRDLNKAHNAMAKLTLGQGVGIMDGKLVVDGKENLEHLARNNFSFSGSQAYIEQGPTP